MNYQRKRKNDLELLTHGASISRLITPYQPFTLALLLSVNDQVFDFHIKLVVSPFIKITHMKYNLAFGAIIFGLLSCAGVKQGVSQSWQPLFDGKSLKDWKVGENATTFTIEDGKIVANGPVAHLFYNGDVNNHQFKNFEFKTEVMTTPGSNSGIYFHTEYQEKSWPLKGYEVQVNNSHTDWRRTGSLYSIDDVREVFVKDNEWYTEHIIVQGKRVIIKINDKTVVDYTEPESVQRAAGNEGRLISSGTFALQGHDPQSKVYYRNLMVKVLPD
jgi:hypothetical protein